VRLFYFAKANKESCFTLFAAHNQRQKSQLCTKVFTTINGNHQA